MAFLSAPGNEWLYPGTTNKGDLATALQWEKSRASHLLTRMENRGFIDRVEDGAPGRRTAILLDQAGHDIAEAALKVQENTVRSLFFDHLTAQQATAFSAWSEHMIHTLLTLD